MNVKLICRGIEAEAWTIQNEPEQGICLVPKFEEGWSICISLEELKKAVAHHK